MYEKKTSSLKLILIRQLFNMKMRETDPTTFTSTPSVGCYQIVINTFSRVFSKFEEDVKALALLSSLPASWEVFCTTFANNYSKLNLDEAISQVLTKDIRGKSMGLTINESVEAHNSTESIDRFNHLRNQVERTGRNSSRPRYREDRQRSKSRNSRSSVFCTHCRKTGHEISDCWSIKRKENGRRFEQNSRRFDSNRSPNGDQINVGNSRSGEILALQGSMIGEVHDSVQDTQTWLLDSSATFHVTPNIEWFSNYLAGANDTIRLGNGQECIIAGIGEVPIRLPNDNMITLH